MNLKHFCMGCLAISLIACHPAAEEQHSSYETVTITEETVTTPIHWSATITGLNDVKILAKTKGQITRRMVGEGDVVHVGQALAELDNRQATYELQNARANKQAAEARVSSAELEYESQQKLFAEHIVSEYMLREAENKLLHARAELAQATAAVSAAELAISYCTITSPVDGITGDMLRNTGDLMDTGDMLTTIAEDKEMTVIFSLRESIIRALVAEWGSMEKLKQKMPELTLTLKDGTEYQHKGKVTNFSGLIDSHTGSLNCYAKFPNPDRILYSGMQGTVSMPYTYENVKVIPWSAIVRLQDKTLVYQVGADSIATGVLVNVEDLDGKNAVVSGLNVGDIIVAKGAINVHDGEKVIW